MRRGAASRAWLARSLDCLASTRPPPRGGSLALRASRPPPRRPSPTPLPSPGRAGRGHPPRLVAAGLAEERCGEPVRSPKPASRCACERGPAARATARGPDRSRRLLFRVFTPTGAAECARWASPNSPLASPARLGAPRIALADDPRRALGAGCRPARPGAPPAPITPWWTPGEPAAYPVWSSDSPPGRSAATRRRPLFARPCAAQRVRTWLWRHRQHGVARMALAAPDDAQPFLRQLARRYFAYDVALLHRPRRR